MPHINIVTVGLKVPTTIMHMHSVMVELGECEVESILESFDKSPRIKMVEAKKGFKSTAEIMEYGRDLLRPRGDMMEICVWKESVNITDGELYYMQAIHQESDIIPENVDCIRAMLELEKDPLKSIRTTDKSLGLL